MFDGCSYAPTEENREIAKALSSKWKIKLKGGLPSAADFRKLHRQVLHQTSKLSIESQNARLARHRHQVLCDFVVHQELILHALQHGLHPLQPGQLPKHSSQAAVPASHPQPSPSAGGSSSSSRSTVASSYVAGLLHKVSVEQLQQVASWTSEDDIKQLTQVLFEKLVALLELIERQQQQDDDEEWLQRELQPRTTAAAATAAGGGPGIAASTEGARSRGDLSTAAGSRSSSNSRTQTTMAAAAATAAASLDLVGAATATAVGSGEECMEMLEQLIDNAVTLTCVGLIYNCRPIVDSALSNQMSQKPVPIMAPQAHWKHVVKRLNLTPDQLFQLRIAADEYKRMVVKEQVEGRALLEKAATYLPCTSLALRAAEDDAAAGAGSSGASSSSAAKMPNTLVSKTEDIASAEVDPASVSAPAAVQGAEQEGAGPDLADLFQKHLDLRLLHMTVVSFFLLNTLSKVQIAKMIVASYPVQVISAAVVEAAGELHRQQERQQQAEPLKGQRSRDPKQDAELTGHERLHMQQRNACLQQQVQQWWHEMGAEPLPKANV